jgi:hypothetical protein
LSVSRQLDAKHLNFRISASHIRMAKRFVYLAALQF